MKSSVRNTLVILLCVVGFALALWGINYPYVGTYNANNNYLSLAAKNYLRFGFINLKFIPTYFAGETLPSPIPYYLHHPILIFLLSAIPYIIFGFHNWVVHVTIFLFLLGVMFLLYKIAYIVWNKKIALWVFGLSMIFPMTSFFWKYIFFEQSSLFFNLCVYYQLIRYLTKKKQRYLVLIFIFTFFSGLTDWGVLYLFFPFIILFFTKYKNIALRPFMFYLLATGLSLSIFAGGVYLLQNGFNELKGAVLNRSYASELTKLSLWPIRLTFISILRSMLYFTLFAIIWVLDAIGSIKQRKYWGIQEITLLYFFIFGSLNIIFLPTATWGHSYFLFYFIPFFSFLGGIWFVKVEKRSILMYSCLFIMVISSIGVTYLKIEQVKKQLWKYDAAVQINAFLIPYETIGVVNFAGDVFENYFLHPSQPISSSEVSEWQSSNLYPTVEKVVFVCVTTCTTRELEIVDMLKKNNFVQTYHVGNNDAWLINKNVQNNDIQNLEDKNIQKSIQAGIEEKNLLLRTYRALRDFLNVGQI